MVVAGMQRKVCINSGDWLVHCCTIFNVMRRYRTRVSESVSQSENLRTELTDVKISIEYFTDVTQAIGDTFF